MHLPSRGGQSERRTPLNNSHASRNGEHAPATLAISSNGSNSGILWAVQFDAQSSGGPAILHAWDANDVTHELYNSNENSARDAAGTAIKFAVPAVANGKVYINAQTEVDVYGLLP